jgi:hypothetical protein
MTLETVGASAAGENERGKHGECGENTSHLSLPSLGFHACSSGGSVGNLRGCRVPIPPKTYKTVRNLPDIRPFSLADTR